MKFTVVRFVCLVLFAGVFADGKKEKMMGGKDADIADFPYQVSLRLKSQGHYCGGTIIGKRHILTAAHCVENIMLPPTYEGITVNTGSSMSSGNSGKAYRVANAVYHENCSADPLSRYKNDIAVVTLSEDIEFNKNTQKIDLASKSAKQNDKAVVTGWGVDKLPSKTPMPVLQKVDMSIFDNANCAQFIYIVQGQICALQKQGVGICSGDSGGPLVSDDEVVGVASWVVPCAKGVPDVYTDVYHFKDWIVKHME